MATGHGAAGRQILASRVTEILLYLLLLSALLLGGGHIGANARIFLLCLIGSLLVATTVVAGAGPALARLPLLLRIGLILVPLVPLAQLIPLPPAVWSALPGRDTPASVFELVGAAGQWHPLTLTPRNTLFALLMLLPPYAAFIAATTLDARSRTRCIFIFLAVAALSVAVGVVQVATRGAVLDFFASGHRGNLIGFFANRNHQGLMLAIAACFSIAVIHRYVRPWQAAASWSAILAVTFLAVVVGTTSRAALGLTVVSLALISYVHFFSGLGRRRPWLPIGLVAATIVVVYFLSYSSVVDQALARFNDVKDDGRWEIWQASWPLVTQYFPWGSGMGSFVPSYAAIEQIDSLRPSYINRAHNEYLEILIEAGIPGLIALGTFVLAIAVRAVAMLTGRRALPPFGAAAMISLLVIGAHSVVDYPLRTQAIAVLFAVILAVFFAEPVEKVRLRTRAGRHEGADQ